MNPLLSRLKWTLPPALRSRIKRQLCESLDVPSVERSLECMRRLGFRATRAIDIGAFKGEWTLLAQKVFPEASYLMLEAQQEQAADLELVKQSCPQKIDYKIALLGPENRDDAVFNQYGAPTGASVLSYLISDTTRKTTRRMQTLDSVLAEAGVTNPDLIKIDVQGYELEVLKGATNCLRTVQAVLMEVSLLELYANNPLIRDVLNFMFERGFVAFDISSLMRCPEDKTLAQVDMIFVPTTSPLLTKKR